MADERSTTQEQLLRGLRIAVLAIASVVLGTASIFRNLSLYQPTWVQLLAWSSLLGVVLVEGVLLLRHRHWPRWALPPFLALAYGGYLAAIVSLPPGAMITSVDWAFGTAGWIYLILVLDRPLPLLGGVLMLHGGITVVMLELSGPVGVDRWLNLVSGSLGALGYPFAAGVAASALRAVARAADAAMAAAAAARTEDEIANRVHLRRDERFTDLHARALPLLQGLADDTVDPADPDVRRRCAIEAARMRRLFAETDTVPGRLLHELRQAVDVADHRGVIVEVESHGNWVDPPDTVRRRLTEVPILAVVTARSRARVTVLGVGGTITVSVLADCDPVTTPAPSGDGISHQTVIDGTSQWVEATWEPTAVSGETTMPDPR